ncbi:uncharacterized protein LOC129588807 isoform X2 [Paramacrobiotus metropolitanus]|nr:uncharacterized protein LOC129588807 isoform X2 [Paramacrobiotus metropolitanus]XP_055339170.1 uncharacterized protein LOC129588807 isoform X2 [Paramacrobiotus metropolitanus]
MIQTFRAHSGKVHPERKWHVECLDGEAIVGIQDFVSDFKILSAVWCKFMFPFKPPTTGMYPFYPICFLRNYTVQFFCFNPQHMHLSVNSFITGFWDDDAQFLVSRAGQDGTQLYKCCKVPPGYYIDYQSCYYMPTHDQYWEYYDAQNNIIVYCATGYILTGLSKKINPYDKEFHIEWIQCCRLGFGGAGKFPPPDPMTIRVQRSVDAAEEDIDLYQDALASIQIPKNYSEFFRQPSNKLLPDLDRCDDVSTTAPVTL